MSIQTNDPPLWSGLLSLSARATALSENRGHCLNCHEDTHALRQCEHPFQNHSDILDPDLGTLGDDGEAFRRWQERMIRHRRENKSLRPHKQHNQKQQKRSFDHSRGQHHRQGRQNKQSDDYNTRGTRIPAALLSPSRWSPDRPHLFHSCTLLGDPRRGFAHLWWKPERTPARHLPRR